MQGNLFQYVSIESHYTNINTDASEMGPVFINDELWYTAYSKRDLKRIDAGRVDKAFYKQFRTPIDKNGYLLTNERNEIDDFDTPFHEGPAAYCEKTGELFLTLSNFINVEVEEDGLIVKRNRMRLRIVVAELSDDKWEIKEEMPFNDPVYSVGHPTITASGDTLFFTSDIPDDNNGETDIYMAVRENGSWSDPINIGDKINSKAKEMFPFYHHGILIFASDREQGLGGLDIYYSRLTKDGFSEVLPIEQLNSPSDDFGLIIHENNELGYFVSNRPGYDGDDNMFRITMTQKLVELKGKVIDKLTSNIIPDAKIELKDCNNNIIAEKLSNQNGEFIFDDLLPGCYKFTASKQYFILAEEAVGDDNYTLLKLSPAKELEVVVLEQDNRSPVKGVSITMNTKPAEILGENALFYSRIEGESSIILDTQADGYLNQTKRINPDFKGMKRDTIFLMKRELNRTFVLENIYYDLDKWDILPESEPELDKLVAILKENPTLVVELGSHTDSRGSDSYNLNLSQRRSESAVAYIVSQGVPRSRIVAKGYGETQLVNDCMNGVECSDSEHRKNRRTEFKILSWE
ncbi:MAG: OmpA family protein [Prolixibacteraceae bacterium]|nr:OmpA family protein [Prolixibacteraceae bacterium]MBN2649643.1 OmpA family protein [Prolixibacteraceae bacterium]